MGNLRFLVCPKIFSEKCATERSEFFNWFLLRHVKEASRMFFFLRPASSRPSGDPLGLFLELSYLSGNKCLKNRSVWFGDVRLLIFYAYMSNQLSKFISWMFFGLKFSQKNVHHLTLSIRWTKTLCAAIFLADIHSYTPNQLLGFIFGDVLFRPWPRRPPNDGIWIGSTPYIKLCQSYGQKHCAQPIFQLIFTQTCQISC